MMLHVNNLYLSILFYSLIVASLSVLIICVVLLTTWRKSVRIDKVKSSAYECGFNPFSETRYKFEVKFYLVSILFIIFDIEVVYLFPWSVILTAMPIFEVVVLGIFLLFLGLGLFYEIKREAIVF